MRETISWWDLRIKSMLLNKLNRQLKAKEIAKKALVLAKEENHTFGINEMNRILNVINKNFKALIINKHKKSRSLQIRKDRLF